MVYQYPLHLEVLVEQDHTAVPAVTDMLMTSAAVPAVFVKAVTAVPAVDDVLMTSAAVPAAFVKADTAVPAVADVLMTSTAVPAVFVKADTAVPAVADVLMTSKAVPAVFEKALTRLFQLLTISRRPLKSRQACGKSLTSSEPPNLWSWLPEASSSLIWNRSAPLRCPR